MPCLTSCKDNFLNTLVMLNYQHLTWHTLILISVSLDTSQEGGVENMEIPWRCWGKRQYFTWSPDNCQECCIFFFSIFVMFYYKNKKNKKIYVFIFFAPCSLFQEQDSSFSGCLSQCRLASVFLLLRLWPDTSLKSLSTRIGQ